jgi:hypothetical protein
VTSAEFDREEQLNIEDMELEFAIRDAGSWAALRQETNR